MTEKKITAFSIVAALAVVVAAVIPIAYVAMMNSVTISSGGSVKAIGVGVYWDSICTEAVSSIDWSIIEPGASEARTVYIKNTGNTDATLSLDTDNWSPPSAATYISLTWDYNGHSIAPDAVVEVTLTLTISASVSGITTFNFDIVIINEG